MSSPMTSARTTLPAQRPSGSATTTTTVVNERNPSPIIIPSSGTLRLRGVRSPDRHIQWADDVIDNEGMGKKSSKVCCIYHKIRPADESSSDESSDSSSSEDSDSEPDNSRARPIGGSRRNRGHRHHHHHRRPHDSGSNDEGDSAGPNGSPKRKARRPSPNAYERMPNYTKKNLNGA